MEYDLTKIHGSLTTKLSLELFDTGLNIGDIIHFPVLYKLRFNNQQRKDFYREALEIESYICCKKY